MYSLVALDTQHIKQYVFPTDKLKEIRGASSLLDHLNRREMERLGKKFGAQKVFANGGSALFLLTSDEKEAERFGWRVQQEYYAQTGGGAMLAFAAQRILEDVQDVWTDDIHNSLDLLHYRLEEAAHSLPDVMVLPSHPLLHPCAACGVNYAEGWDDSERNDPAVSGNRYCSVCLKKRDEDEAVKDDVEYILRKHTGLKDSPENTTIPRLSYAWERLIELLLLKKYEIPAKTRRPADFYELRGGRDSKEYLALIYADGNGMGQVMEKQKSLEAMKARAELIDDAIYEALSAAVCAHLPIPPGGDKPRFPFDVLLVGGDDVLMVTRASAAFDVALTLAQTFRSLTRAKDPEMQGHSLSIGVVLAPVSYPFGLLVDLAESTLKHAKKAGAQKAELVRKEGKRAKAAGKAEAEKDIDTSINFMVVTGSTSQDFQTVYAALHEKYGRAHGYEKDVQFYATLRPYTVEDLTTLLDLIRKGKGLALGRTKLHQVREAVLKMNLTSSVTEGLGVLRNWKTKQRNFVLHELYALGERHQERYQDDAHPETLFPRVTFPWFADGPDTYCTPLLDFVELYDFVEIEGTGDAHEN